jgi:hypothetical protein
MIVDVSPRLGRGLVAEGDIFANVVGESESKSAVGM